MTITPRFGFTIEYVTDVEAAKRFYVDVLGLRVEREHPVFVQFDHFAIAGDESMSGTDDPEQYWLVDDVEAAFRELSAGAAVTTPLKEMPFRKVFSVKNPAGRPCYLLEFAKDRPSRAAQ